MKNIIQFTRFTTVILLAFAIQLSSCKKDDDNRTAMDYQISGSSLKTNVTGKVTDLNNNLLSGITVTMGNLTTTTDGRGIFIFANASVPKVRLVVKATKSGFFDAIVGKKTQSNGVNYVNIVMQELPTAAGISGTAGGVINLTGGARITFPLNAFVDQNGNAYTGNVKVFARHINPAAAGFEAIVPGGDLIGTNAAGQAQSLYSLGMIEAVLKDNSGINEIKLAAGVTAQLQFPIDPSQAGVAQSTIPMWYLNETTGIWIEEGEAVKNGNFFEGIVSHFSTWNCDYQGERTDIVGKVVDCNGVPVAGVIVTINGFMNVITDNSGNYSTWVPAGFTISCQVLQINNPMLASNSPVQTITAVGGILNTIPVLIVPCVANVSGMIKMCNSQTLTAGLIIVSWNGGSLYYYSSTGNYIIPVPENTLVDVTASISGFNGSLQVASGIAGSITNAPDILLCNPIAVLQNKFTITENGISTDYIFTSLPGQSIAYFWDGDLDGIIDNGDISLDGFVNPGNKSCTIFIFVGNFQNNPGNLLVPNSIEIHIDTLSYISGNSDSTILTNNQLIIQEIGIVDTLNTSGTFEFDSYNGTTITNGEFSVPRTW